MRSIPRRSNSSSGTFCAAHPRSIWFIVCPSVRPNFPSSRSASCIACSMVRTLWLEISNARHSVSNVSVAFMAKAGTLEHVKRNSIAVRGGARIEDELRFRIDEAGDKPGRRDPVDSWARASDPGALLILRFGSAPLSRMLLLVPVCSACANASSALARKGLVKKSMATMSSKRRLRRCTWEDGPFTDGFSFCKSSINAV